MPTPSQPQRIFNLPGLRARRTIVALMLREVATTYGRNVGGYLWAFIEPLAGIALLTLIFSLAFRSPPLGTNFGLFYATGILPFIAYTDLSAKVSASIRFSKQLLHYPAVTYLDAIVARSLLNMLTHTIVITSVLGGLILIFQLPVILNLPIITLSLAMTFALGTGIGVLNCYLCGTYPLWERLWAILNRPLFIISAIFFVFEDVPEPYQSWLWWNPIVHIVGAIRAGIYPTYDARYISAIWVFGLSAICLAVGLALLHRHHRNLCQ